MELERQEDGVHTPLLLALKMCMMQLGFISKNAQEIEKIGTSRGDACGEGEWDDGAGEGEGAGGGGEGDGKGSAMRERRFSASASSPDAGVSRPVSSSFSAPQGLGLDAIKRLELKLELVEKRMCEESKVRLR